MAKFKVGDRVRYCGEHAYYHVPSCIGAVGTVAGSEGGSATTTVDWDGLVSPARVVYTDNVELIEPVIAPAITAPTSAVRTVTRREIVPGTYGRIKTIEVGSQPMGSDKVPVGVDKRFYDSTDLRAAASLFNELADVLDEQRQVEVG